MKSGRLSGHTSQVIRQELSQWRIGARRRRTKMLRDKDDSIHSVMKSLVQDRFMMRETITRLVYLLQNNGNLRSLQLFEWKCSF